MRHLPLLVLLVGCPKPAPEAPAPVERPPLDTVSFGVPDGPLPFLSPQAGGLLTVAPEANTDAFRWWLIHGDGTVRWAATPGCPGPDDETMRFASTDDVVLCASDTRLVGVGATTGETLWSQDTESPAHLLAAGDSAAVWTDDGALRQIDPATGEVLIESVLPEEAEIGPARTYSVDDRTVVATPVFTADEIFLQPLDGDVSLWSVSTDGASNPRIAGGALLVDKEGGALNLRDLETGAWLHTRNPASFDPWLRVDGGILHLVTTDAGETGISLIDPVTLVADWTVAWPHGTPIVGGGQSGDYLHVDGRGAWAGLRASDGRLTSSGTSEGLVRTAPLSEGTLVIEDGETSRTPRFVPHQLQAAGELSPPPAQPGWLVEGTTLTWVLVRYAEFDFATGLITDPEITQFAVRIDALEPDLVFTWKGREGAGGQVTVPAEVLAESAEHAEVFEPGAEATVEHTSLAVSRAVLSALESEGSAAFGDATNEGVEELQALGPSWFSVVVQAEEPYRVSVPVQHTAGQPGDTTYEIARYGDWPLIVRAVRPKFLVELVAIKPPKPAPPEGDEAGGDEASGEEAGDTE